MKKILVITVAISSFLLTSYVFAADNQDLQQGIKYYRQENYDEALSSLKKAKDTDPASTLVSYYIGLTYKQMQDYKQAKSSFKEAIDGNPKIKDALIELVDVSYQLGEVTEAKEYIALAEREGIRPAQIAFLKGLTAAKEGNAADAKAAFQDAKALDPSLKQACNYQIGLLGLKDKDYALAKDAFKEVIVSDPNSDMAVFANKYLEALANKEQAEKPLKVTVGAAYQYDDNVILRPSDSAAAGNISNESDTREVVTASAEYNQKIAEKLGIKWQYSLYYANQDRLTDFDVFSNSATIAPTYYFDKATIGVPVGYNYTMVGNSRYLSTISANPTLNVIVGKSQMMQLAAKYQNKNFLKAPLNADENRDSNNFGGSGAWFWFFCANKGFFNLRYEFNDENAKGANWDYFGNKFDATILVPLWEKLKASVAGEIFLQDYNHTHTIFNVKRNDDVYTVSGMLSYELIKDGEIQLSYTHITDNSNIAVYDYDRNIYSAGFQYKF